MTREDIPALRRFDDQLTSTLDEVNAQYPPDAHSTVPGGPWADDAELAHHFEKYQRHGATILLAEDRGRVVGFVDLWPTDEPEPFGRSLDVECIDYFREHYLAGLETRLLAEAEKVARAAGLPALDIGTNTCSAEYVSLRRFGLRVFYEYDDVVCRCQPPSAARPQRTVLTPETADLSGLIRADHWCPTDFTFRGDEDPTYLAELRWADRRAIVELWHYVPGRQNTPVPPNPPNRSELFVPAAALNSPAMMGEILAECAAVAGELGAEEIALPCPSNVDLTPGKLEMLDRQFAFAWLRKRLD
jgi:GNAT superfamily N-acetyltransferase